MAILLLVLGAVVYLLRHYRQHWTAALKMRAAEGITFMTFFVALVVSKMADRSLGMVREITGWQYDMWMRALQTSVEEWVELALPIIIMIYICQLVGKVKNRHG